MTLPKDSVIVEENSWTINNLYTAVQSCLSPRSSLPWPASTCSSLKTLLAPPSLRNLSAIIEVPFRPCLKCWNLFSSGRKFVFHPLFPFFSIFIIIFHYLSEYLYQILHTLIYLMWRLLSTISGSSNCRDFISSYKVGSHCRLLNIKTIKLLLYHWGYCYVVCLSSLKNHYLYHKI